MARPGRRRRHTQRRTYPSVSKALETVAILLLTDADDEEEELMALAVAHLALQARKHAGAGKFGPRGAYLRQKSKDFFQLLMHGFSDRWFKAWLR